MGEDGDWQNLKKELGSRDTRKKFLQAGIIVLWTGVAICNNTYTATATATIKESDVKEIEMVEIKQKPSVFLEAEDSDEKISDIVKYQKRREEERLEKERALQKAREEARAKERQEARRKALAEKKAKRKKEKAEKERAEKEKYMYLLPEESLLGKIIEAEAAKSMEDRRRVGSVVLNRVRTTFIDFRDVHTIHEVLYQDRQYHNDTKKIIAEGLEASPEAKEVAHGLLTGEIPCLPERILFQSRTEKDWMPGHVKRADLPDQEQFYGEPIYFEEGCLLY